MITSTGFLKLYRRFPLNALHKYVKKIIIIMDMNKRIVFLSLFVLTFLFNTHAEQVIKVLALGNSFSADAVEEHLYELGKADNVTFIIGNMVIGGCPLSLHWENANKNAKAYSYRKIDKNGVKTVIEGISMEEALMDEKWDYITFQQWSAASGNYDTYFPYLSDLLDYVKSIVTNHAVKYAFHSTWAYAQNSTHVAFPNYQSDQMTMYRAIIDASFRAAKKAGINIIIPAGTAIQNGRTSSIGDNFCRDGYHLDFIHGRYTVACTWYEVLSGNNVVGNKYIPANMNISYKVIIQKAAHEAVRNPDKVTNISL